METYTIRTPEDVRTLRARLTNPAPVLARVGALIREEGTRAFAAQALGEIAWPERYPGQKGQFLNVAAALDRANRGLGFTARLRDKRPALLGTGALRNSIASKVEGQTVTVGSVIDYASIQQFGGDSYQDVTQTAKDTIRGWLKGNKASVRGVRSKLHSLLTLPFLVTKINARPFIGVTPAVQATIPRMLADYLTTGAA